MFIINIINYYYNFYLLLLLSSRLLTTLKLTLLDEVVSLIIIGP